MQLSESLSGSDDRQTGRTLMKSASDEDFSSGDDAVDEATFAEYCQFPNCEAKSPKDYSSSSDEDSDEDCPRVAIQNDIFDREVIIPNGSLLSFAGKDIPAQVARLIVDADEVPNPLRVMHSAIVINDYPKKIMDIVYSLAPGGINYGKYPSFSLRALEQLCAQMPRICKDPTKARRKKEDIMSFVLELSGGKRSIFSGIPSFIRIRDFNERIQRSKANVFLRPTYKAVPLRQTRAFALKYIGQTFDVKPMVLDSIQLLFQNLHGIETPNRIFCSHLVAIFARDVLNLPIEDIKRVKPSYLTSFAGKNDLVKGVCGTDIPIKLLCKSKETTDRLYWSFFNLQAGFDKAAEREQTQEQ
jgi:hypothetical protein